MVRGLKTWGIGRRKRIMVGHSGECRKATVHRVTQLRRGRAAARFALDATKPDSPR